MKCPYCGRKVEEGQKFCEGCGAKFDGVETKKEVTNSQSQKSGKAGLIVGLVILGVILIGGIIIGIVLLTGGDKDNSNKENNTENNSNSSNDDDYKYKDYSKNIKLEDYLLDEDTLIVFAENKNDKNMFVEFYLDFYDKNDKKIGEIYIGSSYPMEPGAKTVEKAQIYYEDEYDSYKVRAKAEEDKRDKPHTNDVEIKESFEDGDKNRLVLDVKNTGDEKLKSVRIGVVFYKNNKLVGYEEDFETDMEPGDSTEMSFYFWDEHFNPIEYDKYEIFILDALTS